MADISEITLPNGDDYIFKDSEARTMVSNLILDSEYDSGNLEVELIFRVQTE